MFSLLNIYFYLLFILIFYSVDPFIGECDTCGLLENKPSDSIISPYGNNVHNIFFITGMSRGCGGTLKRVVWYFGEGNNVHNIFIFFIFNHFYMFYFKLFFLFYFDIFF